MRFKVGQLIREPVGSSRDYVIGQPAKELPSDLPVVGLLRGRLRLVRTAAGVLASAEIEAMLQLTCGRCLEGFDAPLRFTFDEEYLPTVDILTGHRLPPPQEEGIFTIDGNHILDITEAVRQYTLIGLPMKPLCREGCAGLCPQCGRNLNLSRCDCRVAENLRWSKLKEVLATSRLLQSETD